MIKKTVLILLLAIVFISCGPKVVRQSKKVIKGDWALNSITYSEIGTYKVTIFKDANKACFEGSTWNFIPNNNTGLYNLSQGDCPTGGARNFVFTIDEVNKDTGLYNFLLKPTDDKHKSLSNKGFRVELTHLDGSTMKWKQNLTVEGKPFKIYMNFTKQ